MALPEIQARKALEVSANHGAVLAHANKGLAVTKGANAWSGVGRKPPQVSRVLLAYRRGDVAAPNAAARAPGAGDVFFAGWPERRQNANQERFTPAEGPYVKQSAASQQVPSNMLTKPSTLDLWIGP